jgi:hypothetical protein
MDTSSLPHVQRQIVEAYNNEVTHVCTKNGAAEPISMKTKSWRVLLLGYNPKLENELRKHVREGSSIVTVGEHPDCIHNLAVAQWLSPHSCCEAKLRHLSGAQLYPPHFFDLVWVTPSSHEKRGGGGKSKMLKVMQ